MRPKLIFISLMFCLAANGQLKTDPLAIPFKIEKDTLYAMVDHTGKVQNLHGVQFIQKWWPENGKYHVYQFDGKNRNIVKTGWYSDEALKVKDGVFEEFHSNGMTRDSGLYLMNSREGNFKGWYEDGTLHHFYQYKNNIPVDTGYVLRKDGSLAEINIADQNGNGIFQDYHENGQVRLLGRVMAGERQGTFTLKREDGSKMMNVVYLKDSIIQTKCFENDGVTPAKGSCIFEKVAEFPGGNDGWANFLTKQLKYPEFAIEKNIEGVVRVMFNVLVDGTIEEFEILSSPHESLSKEVLRLMKKSPKREPAILYNKPVIYRHVQGVTFRLE